MIQHTTARIVAIIAMAALCFPRIGLAQTPETPSAQPSASPSASPAQGGLDVSKLTPAQQAELQQAIIKASQNPVGNIAILPFQFNNNYGIGPYTRYQFNMNFQPVVPIMLSKNLNLVARSIIPVINNPSNAPPPVCASPYGCGSTFGIGDIQQQFFFAPKTKPGALVWGAGPLFQVPSASPDTLGSGKVVRRPRASRISAARALGHRHAGYAALVLRRAVQSA